MPQSMVHIENLVKRYGDLTALNHLELDIREGEIFGLLGPNGSGKTTAISCLLSLLKYDRGEIKIFGEEMKPDSYKLKEQIGIVLQNVAVFDELTVQENIDYFCGLYIRDRKRRKELVEDAIEFTGLEDFRKMYPKKLSGGLLRRLNIACGIAHKPRLIIMDEPTSSLTSSEVEFLLQVVMQLREQGVSILYISHKLEEIRRIADTITVLRDGQHIITKPASQMTEQQMVNYMVGREFQGVGKRDFIRNYEGRKPILSVRNLYDMAGKVKNVSFDLYPGEVLGLTGLVGAGRTEVLQCIFGANKMKSGQIFWNGEEVHINDCNDAIKLGIGLIPEGRKIQGLFLKMSVKENEMIVYEKQKAKMGIRNVKESNSIAQAYREKLRVKTPSLDTPVSSLSGGNQQKTIVARWLMNEPKVLFMDEPTHGIDIGAKNEIYKIIDDLAKEGVAVILLSSEMPEILSLADRIMVMHHGYKRGELMNDEADQVKILSYTLEDAVTQDELDDRKRSAEEYEEGRH